jgi:DNA-binding response OmpR family regulator
MNNTKILIIEDNPADIALIEAYLKDASFKHQLYKSEALSEGLSKLWEHKPDLVLLDLKLVDVEGFKTLQQFREKAPDVPVVVLTGFKNEIMGIQSVRAGAQDFLVKGDFDSRSLVRTIRYSLQRFETQVKLQEKAEELSKSEQRNRIAHHIARFGRWEMDIVNNAMKWDDEIFKFFGFPPNSFSPSLSEYLKYVHVEDRAKVERFFDDAIKDGQQHSITHRIAIDNTQIKVFQLNAQVNYDEKANRIMLMGSVQDITDQKIAPNGSNPPKKVDDKDKKTEEPALPPSVFFNLTFNLRTPIASLINFLYLLKETPLSEKQADYIQGMESSLDDLTFSINNWINLSTLQSNRIDYKPAEADLQGLIRNIYEISNIRAEKTSAQLELEVSQKMPERVYTDSQKLTQIIYNLVEVAINCCHPQTKIKLLLGVRGSRHNNLSLLARIGFETQIFSVEEANKMVRDEEAFRAKDIESSIYLPVIIVHRLAEFLQGSTEIIQKTKQKVGINVELPMEVSPLQEKEPPSEPTDTLHILLVEDHDLHRLATKRMLTQWTEKVQVDVAKNGQEGLEKTLGCSYDLILMDLQMPVLNGIEAAIKIRNHCDAPIIALTANESKQEQERCRMIGINDYIVKPFKPEQLFSHIMQQVLHHKA